MTVVRYEPADGEEVICQWFSSDQLQEKAFHQGTLKIHNPPTFTGISRRNLP